MEERYIPMNDGHRLFLRVWRPEGKPVATLHICHGMAEHSLRYDCFASFLTDAGIAVYAQDHRGHGFTKEEGERGWFADYDGWHRVVNDSIAVDNYIRNENDDIPNFLMGHSMGSFIVRTEITERPNAFNGLIIMGTGASKGIAGKIGRMVALSHKKKGDPRLPDITMDKLSFGSYLRKIKNPKTQYDWLSKDEEEVKKYVDDPLCGFVCSSGFYLDLIDGIEEANKLPLMRKINKNLPVLIISGDADPVGSYGRGVKKVYSLYKKAGIKDVELKLIPGGRHEILNETDRDETMAFIRNWLLGIMKRYV